MSRLAISSADEARSERARRRAPSARVTRQALERSTLYSEELGIDLAERSDAAYFR